MNTRILPLLLMLILASGSALAAPHSVTLDVQNMTCALCPITVRKALEHVPGVQQVTVDYASKTAAVQFDDTISTVDRLTEATKAAGYPSTVRSDGK